jgi:hypothetical protein
VNRRHNEKHQIERKERSKMPIPNARMTIQDRLLAWPGVTQHPHRFGGVEFRLGKRELGHIHGDHLVDIPFPRAVRDEVVGSGLAEPHHILPESGWISRYLRQPGDVDTASALFRRSYELAVAQRERYAS